MKNERKRKKSRPICVSETTEFFFFLKKNLLKNYHCASTNIWEQNPSDDKFDYDYQPWMYVYWEWWAKSGSSYVFSKFLQDGFEVRVRSPSLESIWLLNSRKFPFTPISIRISDFDTLVSSHLSVLWTYVSVYIKFDKTNRKPKQVSIVRWLNWESYAILLDYVRPKYYIL